MDDLWKHDLKEKYRDAGLKAGRMSECFQMPDSLIPEIYGTIEKKPDGTLYTTKAQRTGCSMCGFGIHMEKRPHRFDLLYESNPKEWDYLMFHMCKDKDGNDYGWAKVLDYIGVGWEPTTIGGQLQRADEFTVRSDDIKKGACLSMHQCIPLFGGISPPHQQVILVSGSSSVNPNER